MSTTDEIFERDNLEKLLRAIAELHRNLGLAFKSGNQGRGVLWPANRNEMIDALISIAWFCDNLEGFDAYANVFNEFSSALADLDSGTIHPILMKKGGGRPPESTDAISTRCRVAIAATYLMQTGRTKKEITEYIADEYPQLQLLVGKRAAGNAELSESIANWRDEFRKGKIKNKEARDLYQRFMDELHGMKQRKTCTAEALEEIAHHQLKLAAKFKLITRDEVLRAVNWASA
ncbi:MAG: hypothetical protein KIT48_01420 [Pseudolabrys sp.]|nr:hypothetical protein [Pseudolabrys sp.]